MPVEVLLVEDNSADVRIIKEIVSQSSVAVRMTVAEDGEKAVAILADPKFKPDLIITDMSLPKISGLELLRRFRGNGIPVVVFSSSKNPADVTNALELGAKEFVEKPIDLEQYTEAVWKMIWNWIQPPA
jgi:two-component system response regulator